MEAEEERAGALRSIVRNVQHTLLWGFILQLNYSVFIEPQQKQRHQDAFTLYGECDRLKGFESPLAIISAGLS